MNLETINKLCCPFDKSDLTLTIINKDDNENVLEGILVCSKCSKVYPIVSGIPIMSPDEYRDYNLEQPLLENWIKTLNNGSKVQYLISDGKISKIEL